LNISGSTSFLSLFFLRLKNIRGSPMEFTEFGKKEKEEEGKKPKA
jgi:hypothetical protein